MNSLPADEELAGSPEGPLSSTERIGSLDVLRGLAVLGILLANIQDFAFAGSILHDIPLEVVQQSGAHHRLDVAMMVFQWVFIEGRMRTLFSLLFGAGTVLLLDRIERRAGAGRAADIFHRRSMWLVGFGLVHGFLIWNGDILLYYGLLALLVLYPLRHIAGRRLAVIGFAVALVGGTAGLSSVVDLPRAWPAARLQERAATDAAMHRPLTEAEHTAVSKAAERRRVAVRKILKEIAAERAGYLASEPRNSAKELASIGLAFRTGLLLEVLGAMIAGMGLLKLGFLSARWSSRRYLTIFLLGEIVSCTVVLVGLDHARRFGFSDAVTSVWMFLPYDLGALAGMLGNASLMLLLIRQRRLMPVQRALAAVGRMALSNYLATSLLCQFVFKWGPWKLYGALEYFQQIYVVFVVWILNIVFSLVWLRFFAFGPIEWAWRSLTYWRRQPFLIRPVAKMQSG